MSGDVKGDKHVWEDNNDYDELASVPFPPS